MKIPGTTEQSKISQYADDATLTLADDQSVIRSFDIINKFEAATGGKLNMEKPRRNLHRKQGRAGRTDRCQLDRKQKISMY